MVSMSPRKAAPKHITLPPRVLSLSRSRCGSSDSSDSGPATPSPRTPLPYSCDFIKGALSLESPIEGSSGPSGSKRPREEDEQVDDEIWANAWSDDDLELVRSTLLHPFRPLSSAYPPGELAPPHLLDEITTQIVNCSRDQRLVSAKTRKAKAKARASGSDFSSDLSSASGSIDAAVGQWPHTWEATRKRVYLASVEASRTARGLNEEKLPMEERLARPGLRRMDSMDFLDQAGDDEAETDPSSTVGRAMRLSTTLQNSTKQAPSPLLTRSASTGSPNFGLPLSSAPLRPSLSDDANPVIDSPPSSGPSFTLTPASPVKVSPAAMASSRRVQRRPRPSLLQRGRSFTASDLGSGDGHMSDDEPSGPSATTKSTPVSPRAPMMPLLSGLTAMTACSPESSTQSLLGDSLPIPALVSAHGPHRLASPPRSTNKIYLDEPISPRSQSPNKSDPASRRATKEKESANMSRTSSWSDSDDDFTAPRRVTKKLRPRTKGTPPVSNGKGIGRSGSMMALQAGLTLGFGDGLASPFDEKAGMF